MVAGTVAKSVAAIKKDLQLIGWNQYSDIE